MTMHSTAWMSLWSFHTMYFSITSDAQLLLSEFHHKYIITKRANNNENVNILYNLWLSKINYTNLFEKLIQVVLLKHKITTERIIIHQKKLIPCFYFIFFAGIQFLMIKIHSTWLSISNVEQLNLSYLLWRTLNQVVLHAKFATWRVCMVIYFNIRWIIHKDIYKTGQAGTIWDNAVSRYLINILQHRHLTSTFRYMFLKSL